LRQFTGDERQHARHAVNPVGSARILKLLNPSRRLAHIETASFADITYDDSYQFMMIAAPAVADQDDYVTRCPSGKSAHRALRHPLNCYISPVRNAFVKIRSGRTSSRFE